MAPQMPPLYSRSFLHRPSDAKIKLFVHYAPPPPSNPKCTANGASTHLWGRQRHTRGHSDGTCGTHDKIGIGRIGDGVEKRQAFRESRISSPSLALYHQWRTYRDLFCWPTTLVQTSVVWSSLIHVHAHRRWTIGKPTYLQLDHCAQALGLLQTRTRCTATLEGFLETNVNVLGTLFV